MNHFCTVENECYVLFDFSAVEPIIIGLKLSEASIILLSCKRVQIIFNIIYYQLFFEGI